MEPQNLRFGGGVSETVLHPFVFVLALVLGVLVLLLPRNRAISAVIAGFILIPMDQVLLVGGVHFPMLRFIALFGFARILWKWFSSRTPIFSGGIRRIDIAVISFAIATAIAGVALFQVIGAFVYQLGNIYTIFGIYFLLRHLIHDKSDTICAVHTLAYVAVPIAAVMTWEVITGHNPLAVLGGASAEYYATLMARDNRFRATGVFAHPILAGTFGAILIPLFVLLWNSARRNRVPAAIGLVAATIITLASNSSTPMLAYVAGIGALCMWPLRNWMRPIRWAIVFVLVSLHLVMKAPVWHLIARIDISGGSSSYHRFMVVDQCIRHFSDWWLFGVKSTFEWGWDMWDTANQYVAIADCSGLLPFLLFMATIVYGFKYLGKSLKAPQDREHQFFLWALGAGLFANVVAFMGISYVDQTQVIWYLVLAAISAMAIRPMKSPVQIPASLHENAQAQIAREFALESDTAIDSSVGRAPARQHLLAL